MPNTLKTADNIHVGNSITHRSKIVNEAAKKPTAFCFGKYRYFEARCVTKKTPKSLQLYTHNFWTDKVCYKFTCCITLNKL